MLSGLLPILSLFLKMDEPEGIVLKHQGQASDVTRENVELIDPWGSQPK
jgi:hypothetical protein